MRLNVEVMDVNSLTSEEKHDKQDKKGISLTSILDLPYQVLQQIIHRLPTKEAIGTCLASKEWMHLWEDTSKIELELEEGTCDAYKRRKFITFVSRLLQLYDSTILKKFYLSFEVCNDGYLVTKWLESFMGSLIQELRLHLTGVDKQMPVVFPNNLFSCASLKEFHLSMQGVLVLPRIPIQYQNLRILTLENVILSNSTPLLFSGCPSLEELTLIDYHWQNLKVFTISCPSLQKITIKECREDNGGYILYEDHDCCQIRIVETHNLKIFSYEGLQKYKFSLYGSTSVVSSSIKIHPHFIVRIWRIDAVAYFVLNLLKEFTSVKKLSISYNSLMAISFSEAPLTRDLPFFSNLTEFCLVSFLPENLYCEALLIVLQNSPCLQVINFQGAPKDD